MTDKMANPAGSLKPVSAFELNALFNWLEPHFPLVLAVSGGADSMCLMHLLADWLAQRGTRPKEKPGIADTDTAQTVADDPALEPGGAAARICAAAAVQIVTVDHGLRAASADEAQFVQRASQALGFAHTTLRWDGKKPQTGVQAAARAARYELIGAFVRQQIEQSLSAHCADTAAGSADVTAAGSADAAANSAPPPPTPTLVTAHHQDDQGETVLMRLARGSGLDGLAAMSRHSAIGGMTVLRPLLGVSKARLVVTARARGFRYIEDPSNANTDFERVRLRRAAPALRETGLGNAALALSAHRLGRARRALEEMTNDLTQRCAARALRYGYGELSFKEFSAAPEELRLRLLNRLISFYGGGEPPVRLRKLEDLCQALAGADFSGATLHRCRIILRGGSLLALRESGRARIDAQMLAPGASFLWDHRFWVSLSPQCDQTLEVLPLGETGWRALSRDHPCVRKRDIPFAAAICLPSFQAQGKLCAVPVFGDQIEELSGPRDAGAVPLLTCTARAL